MMNNETICVILKAVTKALKVINTLSAMFVEHIWHMSNLLFDDLILLIDSFE